MTLSLSILTCCVFDNIRLIGVQTNECRIYIINPIVHFCKEFLNKSLFYSIDPLLLLLDAYICKLSTTSLHFVQTLIEVLQSTEAQNSLGHLLTAYLLILVGIDFNEIIESIIVMKCCVTIAIQAIQ
jgi:hypothetical protein